MTTPALGADATPQNGSSYGGSLGKSGNPSPGGSGGIQGTPSTRPPSYLPGGYQREAVFQQAMYGQESSRQLEERQRRSMPGLPAWALENYRPDMTQGLEPFGANLFRGNFASTYGSGMNDDYVILPGDRITVRVWGARSYDDVLFVDQQGNIFLPEVGPVRVAGLKQSALSGSVRAKLASVFPENVNIYVNLQSAQPVAVYVAGNVPNPGRYAGGPQDSVMSYLDRAGGILPEQGSYRNIKILRGRQVIGQVDLYSYMMRGELPHIRLKDGDTILVEPFGMSVAAYGLLRQPARYEFRGAASGKDLLNYALPMNGVSHVSVGGMRNGEPFNVYVTLHDFRSLQLADGDRVEFVADTRGRTIMVAASGAIHGASRFPVLKQTRLKTLLEYIAVEPELADIKSVYIRRRSVAAEQKVILADALRRLEQSALTATSASVDEAGIRVKEAELIQNFVQRASQLEPDGVLQLHQLETADIPVWRSEQLDEEAAYADERFGCYLPTAVALPFDRAHRELGEGRDWLTASWSADVQNLTVTVSHPSEIPTLVHADETARYDLRLPEDGAAVDPDARNFPVFYREELTRDVLAARLWQGDFAGCSGASFGVLEPDGTLLEISVYAQDPLALLGFLLDG